MATAARYQPDPSIQAQVEAATDESGQPITRDEVAEIITTVLQNMEGDISAVNIKIYKELQALAEYIENAKSEIAAIRPDEIRNEHIPSATDELDAVVGATEEATGQILDACEQIERLSETLSEEPRDKLTMIVTNVYEACNFQDITGQRITKVVKTLRHIETKVDQLLSALGAEAHQASTDKGGAPAAVAPNEEEKLLNGPSMPSDAIDQDEIDRLLASFD